MDSKAIRTYRDAVRELLDACGQKLGRENFADEILADVGDTIPELNTAIPEAIYQGLVREARADPVGIVSFLLRRARQKKFDVSRN